MNHRFTVLAVAASLFLGATFAQEPVTVEPEVQAQPLVAAKPNDRLADPARVFNVTLPRAASLGVQKSATASGSSYAAPLQIGFARDVADLAAGTASKLDWQPVADGQVAAFSITSTDAASLRVGLRDIVLPMGAKLRFYAPSQGDVFESTAAEIADALARNAAAGDASTDARTFWSPLIEGATAIVEIEIPAGASAGQVALSAPVVSHLVTSPARNFTMPVDKATAATCELDVMCYAAWSAESNAEARIIFTDAGHSFLCSGTLIADNVPGTQVPYFLTANHCISTQASATSMQSYWFWRSTACDSGARGATQTLTTGATLIYSSGVTDTSFMRLNSTPPGGAVFAGWSIGSAPGIGASIVGVHHPSGDLQKISFGNLSSYATCVPSGTDSFSCRGASGAAATFFESTWSSGITEPGSSGSGLFSANGHYLLGQLYGGSGSCTSPGSDFYGRFDVAYNAGLAPYLNGTAGSGSNTPAPGATTVVPAQNYSALWWTPSESGWGLSVTQHNSALFASWFVYNSDGNSRWVVMPTGTWTTPTTFVGDIYSTNGSPFSGAFDPSSVSSVHVGSATLSFASADAGTITYTVAGVQGSKSIARQAFGTPDTTAATNYADLWWNAAESGWGLSINQQFRTLFAVWYTYGSFGQPVWYVMPGGSWNGTTYTGTLYRTSSAPGEFFGAAFDPRNVRATPVGSMSIGFNGANAATMTWTVDGISGSKAITRQPF